MRQLSAEREGDGLEVVLVEHLQELLELEGLGVVPVELFEDALDLEAVAFLLGLVEVVGVGGAAVAGEPGVDVAAVEVGVAGVVAEVLRVAGDELALVAEGAGLLEVQPDVFALVRAGNLPQRLEES